MDRVHLDQGAGGLLSLTLATSSVRGWVSRASVLLVLGLYGCTTTAPERVRPPLAAESEPQIHLSWAPATTRADGSPTTDIAGYKIYYGFASRQYGFLKTLGP